MPTFSYATIDKTSGRIEASNINEAAAYLRSQKKVVIELKEFVVKDDSMLKKINIESILIHLSFIYSSDIILFFRQFSSLIKSGVTVINSLSLLEEQTNKRKLKKLLLDIKTDIEEGKTLADAMKKHKRYFDLFTVSMIESGELGGKLDVILERIATSLEQRRELITQAITGLIYPSIVVIMSIIVINFLVLFVIPKFMPFIQMAGSNLPWNTQLLIDIADWVKIYGKYIGGGLIACFIVICIVSRYKKARYWIDRYKVKIPVVGKIFLYSIAIQFARNMESLLSSGVSILDGLETSKNTLKNEAAAQAVDIMKDDIIHGKTLAISIRNAGYIFPPIVSKMVEVGEETGEMSNAFHSIIEIHEKLLQTYIKRMNSLLEPVLIITLGGIVGFVIWGLIAGVMAMYSSAGG